MRTYYFPHSNGIDLVFTKEPPPSLKRKIDRFCCYNIWSTLELEQDGKISFLDKLHGYIEDNKCYDNTSVLYQKEVSDFEKSQDAKFNELKKFKDKISKCIDILEKLQNRTKKFRESKNEVAKLKDTLEKGYVKTNQRVSGSKRQRRYKKNSNMRYLTDTEITQYKHKIEEAETRTNILERSIKYEVTIEEFLFTLGDIPDKVKSYSRTLNHKFRNYSDTVFLYLILEELIQKLDKDVYEIVLERYKDVLRVEEEEKIHKEKKTKNKTSFYIDEDGNEVTIEENVEQIIYNLK